MRFLKCSSVGYNRTQLANWRNGSHYLPRHGYEGREGDGRWLAEVYDERHNQ